MGADDLFGSSPNHFDARRICLHNHLAWQLDEVHAHGHHVQNGLQPLFALGQSLLSLFFLGNVPGKAMAEVLIPIKVRRHTRYIDVIHPQPDIGTVLVPEKPLVILDGRLHLQTTLDSFWVL